MTFKKEHRQLFVGNRCAEQRTEAMRWRLINRHLVGSTEGHRTDENSISDFSTVVHVGFFPLSDIALSSEESQDDGGCCAITSRYVSVYLYLCVCVSVVTLQ